MIRPLLILVAVLGTGLIAGAFFAFSSFVMGALGKLPPASGMAAMQSINVVVINPLFLGVLFGSAALCLYLGFDALWYWNTTAGAVIFIAAASYVIGTVIVTMALNVPLNEALAALPPDSEEGQKMWSGYLERWTLWNHLRSLAALVSSGLFAWALRLV